MRNRKKFERAGMIDPDAELTYEQSDAIESLTAEEVASLISAKRKLSDAWKGAKTRGIIGAIKDGDDDDDGQGRGKGQTKTTAKAKK